MKSIQQKGVIINMRKNLFITTMIVCLLFNAVFVFGSESENKLGIRRYEETKGNTVCWKDSTKTISVYDDDIFLYSVDIGDSTINMENFSLQLNYTVEAENGTAYMKEETLDFIAETLEQNKNHEQGELYKIVSEIYESEDKNIRIRYPRIENYKGELIQDYMNQSIDHLVKKYAENNIYKSLSLEYSVERSDEKYISILFTGEAKTTLFQNDIKVMDSIILDLDTSQELTVENYIKDQVQLSSILENKSLKPLEYENLKFYFSNDNVVFYFVPSDDSVRMYHMIAFSFDELKNIVQEDIGDRPAS